MLNETTKLSTFAHMSGRDKLDTVFSTTHYLEFTEFYKLQCKTAYTFCFYFPR